MSERQELSGLRETSLNHDAAACRLTLNAAQRTQIELDGTTHSVTGAALAWVVRGRIQVRDGEGECVSLDEGDLLTVAPDRIGRLDGRRQPGCVALVEFDRRWTREATALTSSPGDRACAPFHVDRSGSETARKVARVLRELASLEQGRSRISPLLETSRHLELLALASVPTLHVVDADTRREGAAARERRKRFLRVVEEMACKPLESITLAAVANATGASERQTSRLFRAALGTTFRDYVSELRIERAKSLLRETHLPVISVAAEAGWNSLGHFTTTFRRRTGLTPSAYRAAAGRPQAA